MTKQNIVTVSQVNAYIKNSLDSDFLLQNIWVKGEISNFKLHYSGHMYFSLKDEGGVLRAVMFKGAGAALRFMPENGMQVLARGRISVYPRDGAYQIYIEEMEPEGAGALFIAFEQLKAKLEAEGLFREERKKPLPQFPSCIGVVTSATGAALRDILNILGRRWPMARVLVYPVLVQGAGAAQEIAKAIFDLNERRAADVLIVGRGGGSQEDLWAFNEEIVARAVADSIIPVVSAVGHETDFTICDFVADFRAPTPSAAAEVVVPDREEMKTHLISLEKRISGGLSLMVSRRREQLLGLAGRLSILKRRIEELQYMLDSQTTSMLGAISGQLEEKTRQLMQYTAAVDALSPLGVLARGYAVGTKEGKIIRSAKQLDAGDKIDIRFSDGVANCTVDKVERSQ